MLISHEEIGLVTVNDASTSAATPEGLLQMALIERLLTIAERCYAKGCHPSRLNKTVPSSLGPPPLYLTHHNFFEL